MPIAVEAVLSIPLERLVSVLDYVITKLDAFGKSHKETIVELKKWKKKLPALRVVLRDAQEKKITNPEIGVWLDDLDDLTYDVEDVLEHFNYIIKRRERSKNRALRWFSFMKLNYKTAPKLSSAIASLSHRLDDIIDTKNVLGLIAKDKICPYSAIDRRLEGPVPLGSETVVYGRDDEKRAVIEFMKKYEDGVGVYPIVGMGGVGKTTLARYAYNYEYKDQFDTKAWISISQDYNRIQVYKSIIEFATSKSCQLEDPGAIQKKVEEALQGKRFLLTMDDMWEMNDREWEALKSPFLKARVGSKIIVTTRNSHVADVVRTTKRYITLVGLSETESWQMFCSCAGLDNDYESESNLANIGRKIVAKLGRLPLAIRVVGGLLRWKYSAEEWEAISESLSFKDGMSSIMLVLRLSFDCLPYYLQNCFLFCAMFPEDYEIEEDEIANLWLAAGLLVCEEQGQDLIKQGYCYFHELVSRSLLMKYGYGYQMHDMIRDRERKFLVTNFVIVRKW